MKKALIVAALAVACVAPAMAQNMVINGTFNAGESNWTRWRAPWGASETWNITANGPTAPEGTLAGQGGNGSYGWFQVIPIPASEFVRVDGMWSGDIGGAGWAELMVYSSQSPDGVGDDLVDGSGNHHISAGWGDRADFGQNADIAYKKDSWGMNPPTAWGWQYASLSPHPSGNGGVIHSLGYVAIALKLGGFPMGTVSFDNITLTPEPATMALLGLPALALLRRRRR